MRAGNGHGGSAGNPRCVRIFSITARSSIVASRHSRPPQAKAETSIARTRRSKSARRNSAAAYRDTLWNDKGDVHRQIMDAITTLRRAAGVTAATRLR